MLKIIVTGYISKPEEKTTTTQKKLIVFSVAHEYKEKRENETLLKTQWIECELWNFKNSFFRNDKELSIELLEKGSNVKVTGLPTVENWIDKETGEIKYKLKSTVQKIELIDITEI